MPNADGTTSLGKSNYTDNGVNFFSDDQVTGFTPLMQLGQSRINGVYNVINNESLLMTHKSVWQLSHFRESLKRSLTKLIKSDHQYQQ